MKHHLLRITLILAAFSGINAQDTSVQLMVRIDSIIQTYMDAYRIPGLSIAIVKDGSPYMTKGYGYTSVDKKYHITNQTVFHSASITKVFTATAIMQFVEKGQIKLTDKLIDHLPDFKMKDSRYKEITIEHLLTHSSGLPWESDFSNSPDDSTALEKFVSSLENKKLSFNPGEKFNGSTYSNVAYGVLGLIIQRKSGMLYEDYIRNFILKPSGMLNISFNHEDIKTELKALPHILSGESKEIRRFNLYGEIKDKNPVLKYPNNAIVEYNIYGRDKEHDPNDALKASAQDFNNWMIQLLEIYNDSTGQLKDIISCKTLKDMWALKHSIPGSNTSIGIGWWRYAHTDLGDYVFHVGREPGFSSTLMIFPEHNFGITILCNAMYADQIVWNTLPFDILRVLKMKR